MFENYSKRNGKKRFSKHFSNEKERHLFGMDEDDDVELAYSDADDIPESFYVKGNVDYYDWEDV